MPPGSPASANSTALRVKASPSPSSSSRAARLHSPGSRAAGPRDCRNAPWRTVHAHRAAPVAPVLSDRDQASEFLCSRQRLARRHSHRREHCTSIWQFYVYHYHNKRFSTVRRGSAHAERGVARGRREGAVEGGEVVGRQLEVEGAAVFAHVLGPRRLGDHDRCRPGATARRAPPGPGSRCGGGRSRRARVGPSMRPWPSGV